ncbi:MULTISPECIES: 30S ribosomal protein S6 modification protein [Vibrio]|uniref:30S ribosomal protein S6 modification protein n=1 Tax=Vibrio ostreae TaxID=2841925 RepID=A0A975YPE1_9VIBR|nr:MULTISPECIES: 30S ribosomal protein S6 modification protein [Vibrio]QXO18619.1 hypothetical protein KNV97_10240 [Vibrio ostreae]WGY47087.1 30S ribosomal protein S6 modification protein [Vibrio sp. ABG19]
MFHQSRILVWYEVASQKVVLGEAVGSVNRDVVSLWLHAPADSNQIDYQGYRLSLYDDGGREIANKSVSMGTADQILGGEFK